MASTVTLLMAVHSHQPVGNFGFVFEEAYAKAYEPFLRVLERHPQVRLALHYSGCLLDWLTEHQPAFLDRLCQLVARQQVELLASGYYEPILPMIPEADRQGQIAKMRQTLWKSFGTEGTGLWLTERVWEPELPATLSRAGIRYTMVDTNQFAAAKSWLPAAMQVHDNEFWDLLGCYSTEYAGASTILFPASKRLRYWMPFQAVERTIEFLRRLQRQEPVAVTFADDGEKFGLWPKTHHWVYEEGWLEQFLTALERERSWLKTTTFSDYLKSASPNGTIFLPAGSYEEMLEWSGGHFRNFFTKYPEAYAMQQKMLRVSRTLEELGAQGSGLRARGSRSGARDALLRRATQALYMAQCNCAYWHGVFGGLYLTHLRRAVYAHLIAAEALMRQAARKPARGRKSATDAGMPLAVSDVDSDGQEEVSLPTEAMQLIVDPAEGGAITEWSLSAARLNLLDTLSRRHEPYHDKLRTHLPAAQAVGSGVASIHDLLGVKEQNLESYLVYDDHRRSAFLDYGLQHLPSLQEVVRSAWGERRVWSFGPYQLERAVCGQGGEPAATVTMTRQVAGWRLRKTVALASGRPTVTCRYDVEGPEVPVVALEFNLSLHDARWATTPQQHQRVGQFDIVEPAVDVGVKLAIEPAATLMSFPIETVSESEGGLERTFQGICLLLLWTLNGARSWTARVDWTVGGAA
jgi:alpha-amylase